MHGAGEPKAVLNRAQQEAVTTIHGPVLVIAGAGSGKTRAIEYRASHLVQQNIDPQNILLLTFTRKAAHEMLSRATHHDARCSAIEGGTFHSFAFRMLKKHGRRIGLVDHFSILDEADAEEAIHRCASLIGAYEKVEHFPKKGTLRAILSAALNKNLSVSDVLRHEYPHFVDDAPLVEELKKSYGAYKKKKHYLDYDDLLVNLRTLLEEKEFRESLATKYQFVMVDEYQDTNILQGDISFLLAQKHRNIMVVGDDAQSIYGFRGASHENIMQFPARFPGCKIIKLEENYRSTQAVLDVANAVLATMRNKYAKCLVAARREAGPRPQLSFFRDAYDEADWVVSKIKELRDAGVELHRQAVLFRSAYTSIQVQAALSNNGIPYQVFGGLKFYETAHVKDVLAHLKVIVNPRDEISWHRILTLLPGIGPRRSEAIAEEIVTCTSIGEIAKLLTTRHGTGHTYASSMVKLAEALSSAHKLKKNPGACYETWLGYYHHFLREKFDDWHIRINDLEAMRQITSRYQALEELLADFAIEPPDRSVAHVLPSPRHEEKPLVLSTIHSAKGLEWDSVFIIGLIEGMLPISFALGDENDIEEEQRLFYVALTRAKNRLFLSLHHESARGGLYQFNKLSRFLEAPGVLETLERTMTGEREMMDQESFSDAVDFFN